MRLHRGRGVGCVVCAVWGVGVGAERLVGVGSLFGDGALVAVAVVVGRAAGAAAGADEPEQAGSEGEGDSQPGGGEHVLAHGAGDAVGFQAGLESGVDGGVERGGSS